MSNKIIESKYYNRSIYQARPLIEACKQFDLNEGRLFYLGLLELKPQLSEGNGQAEFEKIVIPTADVIKLFGGNASYYTKLRPIARKLRGTQIYSPRTLVPPFRPWYFSFCHFTAGTLMVTISFRNQALSVPAVTANAYSSPVWGR